MKNKISILILLLLVVGGVIFVSLSCNKENKKDSTAPNAAATSTTGASASNSNGNRKPSVSVSSRISADSSCTITINYNADGSATYSWKKQYVSPTATDVYGSYSLDTAWVISGDSAYVNLDPEKHYWQISFEDPTQYTTDLPVFVSLQCKCKNNGTGSCSVKKCGGCRCCCDASECGGISTTCDGPSYDGVIFIAEGLKPE